MKQDCKLFLTGITSAGNLHNLKALVDPVIDFFDGLMWTFHYPTDEGADYLEANKKEGRIVYSHWHCRHGVSMSQFLWQGTMKDGDFFVTVDSMERLSPSFCSQLRGMVKYMDTNNIAMVANYGKGLVFRFNEQLEFKGSPHWHATQLDGQAVSVELPLTDFWNVRNEQRDEYQWVGHYLRYFMYPAGSNHALLGLDHHKGGTPESIFPKREAKRLWFREQVRRAGFPLTVEGAVAFMSQPLTDELRSLINSDKVWQDAYWHLVKGDQSVRDSHNPEDGKRV